MKVLVVEDELPIAEDIKDVCARYLSGRDDSIHCELALSDALHYVSQNAIDVLILDLNLSGRDGFEILQKAVSYSFHTIVVSANIDRAIEAFEYGVVDFIPKPYSEERIRKALDRLRSRTFAGSRDLRYLTVRRQGRIQLIAISDIEHIRGADVYAELILKDGKKELHDKTLRDLARMLPPNFLRIHKSFIIDVHSVKAMRIHAGGKYEVELKSRRVLPVSRAKFKELKEQIAKS
jgi:DNA-binding LytR/AlgR family response regulator